MHCEMDNMEAYIREVRSYWQGPLGVYPNQGKCEVLCIHHVYNDEYYSVLYCALLYCMHCLQAKRVRRRGTTVCPCLSIILCILCA